MGKVLKKLLEQKILGKDFQVELNKEPSEKSSKVIHVSINETRLEFSKKEFYEIVSTLILAEKNLKILKKIK